ncbi:heptaprenyl diphosphate synthase component 1 [Salisediminibacterium selenitireducens]|uniref:Heptaprenyl diphosphate synthase subunit 1 n=1 Tax=Bacillus selenitireducens (strain ATCC 700615 / DSM 15326 / MLS10) TaxID=439292 RepID=D6XVA2_BACIE|nr:heptaprenyl diphosphate synthase component 1 [Salisediminibacterium selenitireducens]ADH99640.1 Heptaprenyl diphosphate synthase subunit 1 [[Bacillus] selenitireducens MLS10]
MALNHHDSNLVHKVITSFNKAVDQPYLKQFLGNPEVSDSYISSLLFLFGETDFQEEDIHDAVLTTLLVQTALDTHERINRHGLGRERIRTERQLTVLAGDYYSALYYFILSRCNNSKLLHALSLGIQNVNEAKMSIYQSKDTGDSLDYRDLQTAYTGIAEALAESYELVERTDTVKDYLLLRALLEEKKKYSHNQISIASRYIERSNGKQGMSVEAGFDKLIDGILDLFIKGDAEYGTFQTHYPAYLNEIHEKRKYCNTYAMEEG